MMATLSPDAFFLLYAASLHVKEGKLSDWVQANELLQRAIQMESMLPVRRMCLYVGMVAESTLYNESSHDEEAAHRTKALELIGRLVEMEILPAQALKIMEHCESLNAPIELVWRVYAAWERADKNDRRLPLARARILLRSHDYESAIRLAEERLKQTDDRAWRELRAEAETQLRKRSEAVMRKAASIEKK